MINRANLDFKPGLLYGFERRHAFDKDKITIGASMRFAMRDKKPPANFVRYGSAGFNWQRLLENAHQDSIGKADNPFYMSDRVWRNKFRQVYPKMKDAHAGESYERSPEYKDLEAFLQVAKANNIQVKLILLPVNGRWYDYTGLGAEKRAVVGQKVERKSQNSLINKILTGISLKYTLYMFLFMALLYIFSLFGSMLSSPTFTYAEF